MKDTTAGASTGYLTQKFIDAANSYNLGGKLYDWTHPSIDPLTNQPYKDARNYQPRRDPLTLDLDGDGIETVGISTTAPILFDHDGDGIKNGTGWVKPDDGLLVLDRNGNGLIDNGRELFGDNTIKSNGQKAIDGFDALKDLDSNNDGVVNASDGACPKFCVNVG